MYHDVVQVQVSRNFGQKHAFDGLLHGSFVELGLKRANLEASKAASEKHGHSCSGSDRDPLCFPSSPVVRVSGLLRLQGGLLSFLSHAMQAQL